MPPLSDVNDATSVAAEPAAAPEAEAVDTPRPISTEAQPHPDEVEEKAKPEPKAKPAEKPLSTRDALKKAAEKVEADEKAKADPKAVKTEAKPKVEAKPEAKTTPERGEHGHFAPKEGAETKPAAEAPKATNFVEAPQRFSTDAKAAWKDAPEPVRAEVHRAVKELEQGYQKHRADAEAYAQVKPFADLAQKSGTTLKDAMERYVGMEQRLKADPVGGLERICQNLGISLRDVAAHVMGQKPDQIAARSDKVIGELQRELATLKQQVGGVTKTMETQRTTATHSQVSAFAASPGHERFDELSNDIAFFLKSGRTADLGEAYQLAERLNPAAAKTPAAAAAVAAVPAAPTAQNRAGQKSISGAPATGSTPAKRSPAPSIRDAIKRAQAAAG